MPKLITKYKLNIRSQPSTQSDSYIKGVLKKGAEVEVTGELINGNDGKNWYIDASENYYWADGFEKTIENIGIETTLDSVVKYEKLFTKIPDNKGKNINIAILDSGTFVNHTDFIKTKLTVIDKVGEVNLNDKDKLGHGTHVTGLISANTQEDIGIVGLANESNIIHFNVHQSDKKADPELVKAVLEYINNKHKKFDIINISFDLLYGDYETIIPLIESLANEGIIFVGSGGNNETIYDCTWVPAASKHFFAIASVEKNFGIKQSNRKIDSSINYILRDCKFWSTDLKSIMYSQRSGASMATALLTGIIARLIVSLENINKKDRFSEINNCLKKISKELPQSSALDLYTLYRNETS